MTKRIDRTGFEFVNKEGYRAVVVEYINACKVLVKFDNGDGLVPTTFKNCSSGSVRNPYHKSLVGIGYIGVGEYNSSLHGKETTAYSKWKAMVQRCYDGKNPSYNDCTVCEEWHCFQNFAKWYESNVLNENIKYDIDKDILVKGNREYSPTTCCLVPHQINGLLAKSDSIRGGLPIGVTRTECGTYIASLQVDSRAREHLGCFPTPELAFEAYKEAKERRIKAKASEYKDYIDEQVYTALLNYEVDIDD